MFLLENMKNKKETFIIPQLNHCHEKFYEDIKAHLSQKQLVVFLFFFLYLSRYLYIERKRERRGTFFFILFYFLI